MKHKKLLILVTVLFFVTVLIICFSALFKVVDVSVNAETIVNSNEKVLEKTEAVLKNYDGKNLVFVSEKEIKKDIESKSPYIKVTNVKKEFPNKIEVTVVERKESFSLFYNNEYYVLDDEFVCVAKKQENVSNIENKRNVFLNLNLTDFSVTALEVGKTFTFNDEVTTNYFKTLSAKILSFQADISSVAVKIKENSFYNRCLILNMREGVKITIDKANENSLNKLEFAYSYYLSLDDKSVGEYVISVNAESGEFIVS